MPEGEDGDGPTRHTPLPVDIRRAGRHRSRPRCVARRQTNDAVRPIRRVLHPPGGLRGDGRGVHQGTFRIEQIRADTSSSGADDVAAFRSDRINCYDSSPSSEFRIMSRNSSV